MPNSESGLASNKDYAVAVEYVQAFDVILDKAAELVRINGRSSYDLNLHADTMETVQKLRNLGALEQRRFLKVTDTCCASCGRFEQ